MSVQPQPNDIQVVPIEINNDAQVVSAPTETNSPEPEPGIDATGGQRFAPLDLDGMGNLLFQMHSSFVTFPLCEKQETTLQFYEHVVVAIVNKKLWCFPNRSETKVIPRFKIVDMSFTLGPRKIPPSVWILLLLSIIFIVIGATTGGCNTNSYAYRGGCAWLVIGLLIIVIPVPILLLVPWFFKIHHVYLDTNSKRRVRVSGGIHSHLFCFQKVGFKHATDDNATFDQFYLFDYICKPFGKQGADNMTNYHFLSHLNYVDLADPIETGAESHTHQPDFDKYIDVAKKSTDFAKKSIEVAEMLEI